VERDPRVEPVAPPKLEDGLMAMLADAELQARSLRVEWLLVALGILPSSEPEAVGPGDEVGQTFGLRVYRQRVELGEDAPAGLRHRRSRELPGGPAVGVDGDSRRSRSEPRGLKSGRIDLHALEAEALDPHRVAGRRGVKLGERQHAGLVELPDRPPSRRDDPPSIGQLVSLGGVGGER
jgi:hypothetical protein